MQKSLMSTTVVSLDPGTQVGPDPPKAAPPSLAAARAMVSAPRENRRPSMTNDAKATSMLLDVQNQLRRVQEDVGNLLNDTSYNIQQDVRVLGSLMRSLMEQSRLQHEEQTKAWKMVTQKLGGSFGPGEYARPVPESPSPVARREYARPGPTTTGDVDTALVPKEETSRREQAISEKDVTLITRSSSIMNEHDATPPVWRSLNSDLPDVEKPAVYEEAVMVPVVPETSAAMETSGSSGAGADDFEPGAVAGTLFDAIAVADHKLVRSLLKQRADPNERRDQFTYQEKQFGPLSLLPLAVMSADIGIVRELIKHKAALSSDYGFVAGTSKLEWSGSAIFGTIPNGNLTCLKQLVNCRADPHDVSSNDANLVWQCCYFGQLECLEYLVSLGVSCHDCAKSADQRGISLTPLHTAARNGNASCIKVLLAAKADLDTTNELNLSPLDDAITQCKAAVVRMLVSNGAQLLREKSVNETNVEATPSQGRIRVSGSLGSMSTNSKVMATLKDSIQWKVNSDRMRALDLLFAIGNPVIVAAAAEGLKNQEGQMKELSTKELCQFLTTSGESPGHTFKAMFCKRDVMYVSDNGTRGESRVHIVTAHIRKPQMLPNGREHEYMNVTAMNLTFADLQYRFKRREKLDAESQMMLAQLAPQVGDKTSLMSSVSVFESLVPNIHNDLQIIRAIAKLDNEFYELKTVQSVIQYCWLHTRNHAVVELICHSLLMFSFFFIGVLLRPPNPEEQGYYIRCLACLGGFIWVFEFLSEVMQMLSFHNQGWISDYLSQVGSFVDWSRLAADACTLGFLWYKGLDSLDYALFLVTFALCSFYKWIMILYALTPFRIFGLSIIPILHTMLDVGPFFTVLAFFMLGLMHGYMSLNVPDISLFESGLLVYRLGLLGEMDPAELDAGNKDYYYVTRIFFIVVCFSVTVTLMNTFIAALGNSFSIASSKMEILFQSHRADRVLSHMAVSQGIRKVLRTKDKHAGQKASFWFCCASERETDRERAS